MSKARDLADLISSGAIETGEITSLDAAKLTGTIADARIPNLAASKITSGTFADARIASSNVSQHATTYDDSNIRSDISALALREATNETSAAFNLPNSFVETFATDVLGTKTNVFVNSAGYSNTVSSETGLVFLMDGGEGESAGSQNFYNKASGSDVNRDSISGDSSKIDVDTGTQKHGSNSYYVNNITNEKYRWEFNANADWNFGTGDFSIDGFVRYGTESHEHSLMGVGDGSNTGDFYIRINEWNNDQLVVNVKDSTNGHLNIPNTAISPSTWLHLCVARKSGTIKVFIDGNSQTVTSSTNWATQQVGNSSGKLTWGAGLWAPSGANAYLDAWRIYKGTAKYFDSNFTPPTSQPTATTSNATGTAIQAANTVGSAKTQVSGTMLYKDNSGTATLGTDLKIYFTCNGGTNWTEAASYNAITPVYATGIKQVRLGKTTCTSGTDIRYKAVWANQAVGSKETQLHGISTNY